MKTKRKKLVVALAIGAIAVGVITASTVGAIYAGNDGKTEQPVIPAHQHTYEEHPATATCEEDGLAAYYSCACGKYFDLDKKEIAWADIKEAPATGHTYVEHPATESATCETAGHRTYLACDCGKYFDLDKNEVNIDDFLIEPAKGHIYTEHAAVAATCETAGSEAYYTCKNCNKMLDANKKDTTSVKVIPALGHTYDQHAAVSPTCETAGRAAYYTCHCGKYFDTDKKEINAVAAIPALGHQMAEVGYQAPSGTKDGIMRHYRCTRNGCNQVFKHNDDTVATDPANLVIPAAGVGVWLDVGTVSLDTLEITETNRATGEVIRAQTMTKAEIEDVYGWAVKSALCFGKQVILRSWESQCETGACAAVKMDEPSEYDATTFWTRDGNTLTVVVNRGSSRDSYVYKILDGGYLEFTSTWYNPDSVITAVGRLEAYKG